MFNACRQPPGNSILMLETVCYLITMLATLDLGNDGKFFLVDNAPLVQFLGNYGRDPIGIFHIRSHSFPAFKVPMK